MNNIDLGVQRYNSLSFLPDDILLDILHFLDDKTILIAIKVCLSWRRCSNNLIKEREKAVKRIQYRLEEYRSIEASYSSSLAAIFHRQQRPLYFLPLLQINNRISRTFDVLHQNLMRAPIMRIKDPEGKIGIAFHLKAKQEGFLFPILAYQAAREKNSCGFFQNLAVEDLTGIYFIYQENGRWYVDMVSILRHTMFKLYATALDMGLYKYDLAGVFPGQRASLAFIENLLAKRDPLFQIVPS